MANNFRLGWPEAAGLAIVGSTIGALLGGAGQGQHTVYGFAGAVIGGALPFVAVMLPRFRRLADRDPAA